MARGISSKAIFIDAVGARASTDAPTSNGRHATTRVDPSLEQVAREAL